MKKYKEKKKYKYCFIISGPEPQRSVFEELSIQEAKINNDQSVILLGKPEKNNKIKDGNLTIIDFSNSEEINQIILQSEVIISRSAYSTIMDLQKLNAKAIFIPTKGQTEQEYLAKKLEKNNISYFQNQKNFNLKLAMKRIDEYSGFVQEKEEINWKEKFKIFLE